MSGDVSSFPQDSATASTPAASTPLGAVPPDSAAGDATPPQFDAAAAAHPSPIADAASESAASGEPAGDRLRQLEAELESLKAENESLRGQYMRIAADFDNFRKRQSRDQDDLRTQIACSTLSEILPVVDNFERARQQLNPQHEEAQSLHGSYQGLYKQLVDVFKQLGVAPMRVEGEPFDPNFHEAVLREPSDEHPEDVVITELQRGYRLNDRVLRHALVKVSMGPGPGQAGGAPAAAADQGDAQAGD
ncbi:nucleotide exchange factor GrpE [Vulcanococcus limneticus]|uniref:nucleotide exchange factor GrpE n=1 Tax=Vulcanococcus limneticus TaxID=2170428 RepID=UPI00398BE964